jgi:hypothetical protein
MACLLIRACCNKFKVKGKLEESVIEHHHTIGAVFRKGGGKEDRKGLTRYSGKLSDSMLALTIGTESASLGLEDQYPVAKSTLSLEIELMLLVTVRVGDLVAIQQLVQTSIQGSIQTLELTLFGIGE